jgi:dienelactone hydrolase
MSRSYFTASLHRTTALSRGEERWLELAHGAERIPASFLVPAGSSPASFALLLHGFSSNKERMAQSVGRALLARGVGSLALDLPFHGERGGAGGQLPYGNPLALVTAWRTAIREARAAIEWLAEQPEVDAARLGVVGYSLGGFLALSTASEESRVRVIVLAAAGDLPDTTPYAALLRRAVDPLRAVRKLSGRPLLLVKGRRDTTTRPAQAERLFAFAEEPKRLAWYEGGHWPPPSAIDDAAEWMSQRLQALSRDSGRLQAG